LSSDTHQPTNRLLKKAGFDLKGRGFSRAVSATKSIRLLAAEVAPSLQCHFFGSHRKFLWNFQERKSTPWREVLEIGGNYPLNSSRVKNKNGNGVIRSDNSPLTSIHASHSPGAFAARRKERSESTGPRSASGKSTCPQE
jgi:hypothetical protein